jgi:replicative DNA helicase
MSDQLPQNVEAEEAHLGSLLIDPDALLFCADILKPDDYYIRRNGWIYEAILDLHRANKPFDLISIEAELKRQDREVGGGYLIGLMNQTPSSLHSAHYAGLIKEASIKRQLITAAGNIAKISYNGAGADEAISKSMAEVMNVSLGNITSKPRPVREFTSQLIDEVTALADGHRKPGIPTGLSDLNRLIGGYKRGKSHLIAGRPGMGKSALALQSAIEAAKLGNEVLYFSLEMLGVELITRMVSYQSGIDSRSIENGAMTPEQWDAFFKAAEVVRQWPIYIDDRTRTIEGIRAKTILQAAQGLDLLMVDYIQRVQTDVKYQNRDSEVGAVGTTLKTIALDLSIPVVAISSLSRQCESRHDKRPMLSDLRESGNLEYDADVIMFLYRDEIYNKDTEHPNLAEIEVAKQRGGPVGTFQTYFRKINTKFLDLEVRTTSLDGGNDNGKKSTNGSTRAASRFA